jgi:hypothetical protein
MTAGQMGIRPFYYDGDLVVGGWISEVPKN